MTYDLGRVLILVGSGDGTFQLAGNYDVNDPYSVTIGDFNGDGKADLALANRFFNTISILLGNGDGTFQAAVNYGAGTTPISVTTGDFNGDGKADLAVANDSSNNVSILINSGRTLTVSKSGTGSGTITATGISCGADCSEIYDNNTNVTLTATPDTGSTFTGWSGDADYSDGSVTMNADKNCTATFTLNTYTVTPSAGTGGNISPSTPQTVNHGSTTVFTITPDTGYSISSVTGCDGSLSDDTYTTGAITEDCTVTATFAGIPNISSSVSSLNFGNVNVGVTSASQTVTVTNTGTANLSISAVTLTGTNSSEYIKQVDTCAGNSLSPSLCCNVQIAFLPASAGAKTAGLAITSNDPDTATLNIPLSGTGVQPSAQQPEEPMSVVLSCPTNVTAGNALSVTVKLYNYDCASSVSVNRLMAQLMGNSSGTLMGLGIWGPYNKSISTKTVPAATCDEFGNVTPGGPVSFSLTIMSQTPAALAGKMSEVTVDAITSKGESLGSGTCMVNVSGAQ